jgi:hypothetical protein
LDIPLNFLNNSPNIPSWLIGRLLLIYNFALFLYASNIIHCPEEKICVFNVWTWMGMMGGWKFFHNEKVHILHCSLNIIFVIRQRRMWQVFEGWQILRTYNFQIGKTQEYDESANVRIILGCCGGNGVGVYGLDLSGPKWGPMGTLVHSAKGLYVPQKEGNFLTIRAIIRRYFSNDLVYLNA